jgi:hypothetical protein
MKARSRENRLIRPGWCWRGPGEARCSSSRPMSGSPLPRGTATEKLTAARRRGAEESAGHRRSMRCSPRPSRRRSRQSRRRRGRRVRGGRSSLPRRPGTGSTSSCVDASGRMFAEPIRKLDVDLLFNVHSLSVLDSDIVRAPHIGSFNLHPGLLPEYAGLNAPSWAIYRGGRRMLCGLHWMDAEIDSGPVAYRASFAIDSADTGLSLTAKCARSACRSSCGYWPMPRAMPPSFPPSSRICGGGVTSAERFRTRVGSSGVTPRGGRSSVSFGRPTTVPSTHRGASRVHGSGTPRWNYEGFCHRGGGGHATRNRRYAAGRRRSDGRCRRRVARRSPDVAGRPVRSPKRALLARRAPRRWSE